MVLYVYVIFLRIKSWLILYQNINSGHIFDMGRYINWNIHTCITLGILGHRWQSGNGFSSLLCRTASLNHVIISHPLTCHYLSSLKVFLGKGFKSQISLQHQTCSKNLFWSQEAIKWTGWSDFVGCVSLYPTNGTFFIASVTGLPDPIFYSLLL